MLERIKQLFTPPTFDDAEKTQKARLPHVVLLTMFVISVVLQPIFTFVAIRMRDPRSTFASIAVAIFLLVSLGLNVLLRRGYIRASGGVMAALLLFILSSALVTTRGGINNPTVIFLGIVIVLAGLLVGGPWTLRFTGLIVLIVSAIYYAESQGLLPGPPPAAPARLYDLMLIIVALSMFGLLLRTATHYIAENEARVRAANQELQELSASLQKRVTERTRDLARRTGYLEAATAVAREAQAVEGDLPRLLPRVVNAIGKQFGFYHIGLFLRDASGEWMVLQAASSEGGQRMLARGHRLRVGAESIVGYVAARGGQRIALDVGADAVFFDNPDLPDTRSEMAASLRVRGEVVGVLDVQSTESQAFTDEDVATLQSLADQVAMAVNNAQLLQQVEASIEAERHVYGERAREAWRELLGARADLGFYDDGKEIVPAGELWRPEMKRALSVGKLVRSADDVMLAMPIRVRDQVVGVLDGRKPDGTTWSSEEIDLLQTLTEQLSVALESARLYQDTQRRATRERLTGEITARMRETLDVETVLEAAAGEIRRALGLDELVIRLIAGDRDGV